MSDPSQHDMRFMTDVLARLETCGIASGQVTVAYEDVLQDYNIAISASAEALSEEQYLCLARLALENAYTISFEDDEARARLWHATQKAELELARSWLEDRGMLASLPLFDPAREDLATYVRALEAYCGVSPGTALEVKAERRLRVLWQRAASSEDQFWTLMHAITASNLREHGISTGVIGGT